MSPDRPCSGNPRLLIADDDAVVRSVLAQQLGRTFTVVGKARDADEAIELAGALRPDVMIVDVQMPAGGGLRATYVIHDRSPNTAIVAFSSDESDAIVRAILEAGAVTYVRKGTGADELGRILRTAIKAHTNLQASSAAIPPHRHAAA
jgi:DNA-binding NarL/FixJ family response regulator